MAKANGVGLERTAFCRIKSITVLPSEVFKRMMLPSTVVCAGGLHIVDFGREQGSICLEAHLDFDNLLRSEAGKIVSRSRQT